MESFQGNARKSRAKEPLLILAGVSVLAIVIVMYLQSERNKQADLAAVQEQTTPVSETKAAPQDTPKLVIEPVKVANGADDQSEDGLQIPKFDLVRVDAEGAAVVAGQAAPGSLVEIMANGKAISDVVVGPDGAFVALFDMPKAADPVELTLYSATEEGSQSAQSQQAFLVMPIDEAANTVPKILSVSDEGVDVIQGSNIEVADIALDAEADETAQIEEPTPEGDVAETALEAPKEQANALAAATLVPDTTETAANTAETVETVAKATAGAMEAITQTATKLVTNDTPAQPTVESTSNEASVLVLDSVVAAPEAPQQAAVTPDVSPTAPKVVSKLSLETISYSETGDVVFAGRGVSDQAVRVYVDNKPVQVGAVADGAWRLTLPDVDEGIYTVRVDAVNDQGQVMARVESPFKRETPNPDDLGPAVTVQPGLTLWRLAEKKYGSGAQYVQIFEANRDLIKDPDLIYPGQIFDLPDTVVQ